MKYIVLALTLLIFNYQPVNAAEGALNKKYFTDIYNNLQNNHFNRGECAPFEIDDNIEGKIRYYKETITLEGPGPDGPNGTNRFKPNCNDVVIFNDNDIYLVDQISFNKSNLFKSIIKICLILICFSFLFNSNNFHLFK